MLIVESLDSCRTCPGVPLERYGPFLISTQNEMPWSCSQRWRRKVQSVLLPWGKTPTIPASFLTLTLYSPDSDTVTLVRILTNRSNAQRQLIAKTFEEVAQKVICSAQFNSDTQSKRWTGCTAVHVVVLCSVASTRLSFKCVCSSIVC